MRFSPHLPATHARRIAALAQDAHALTRRDFPADAVTADLLSKAAIRMILVARAYERSARPPTIRALETGAA